MAIRLGEETMRRRAHHCLSACLAIGALLVGAGPLGRSAVAAAGPAVWPLGDSVTLGLSAGGPGNYSPGGYRAILDSYLNQDGVAHDFVGSSTLNSTPTLTSEGQNHHDGHSGYRIDQDAADLDGVAGAGTDDGGYWMTRASDPIVPDAVIIDLGGNDILQHYDPARSFPTLNGQADYSDPSQVSTFVADMTGRLRSLVDKVEGLHPGTRVVLSDATPIGTGHVDPVTGAYADAVRNLAGQEGAAGVRLVFADVWSQFVEAGPNGPVIVPGLISADQVHPTPAGYQVIASVYRPALESVLSG
ncbi:MAG TPA: GDSL-type esterase/lipase family protein [Acidimicrobiales bacterium]|nr:GDSL-type esterase/lipase family protein [Acidimicrobiales bacterium]